MFSFFSFFISSILAGNEGYTVVNINVGDVNDNAPYLNLSKQLIIWENEPPQFIGIVTCYDPDGPDNGPPFFMSQANNSTYTNLINVVFDQSKLFRTKDLFQKIFFVVIVFIFQMHSMETER